MKKRSLIKILLIITIVLVINSFTILNSKMEGTYAEANNITLEQYKKRQKLNGILGELYFMRLREIDYENCNVVNGIPSDDHSKYMMFVMLASEHSDQYNIIENYGTDKSGYEIPISTINQILYQAIGTKLTDNVDIGEKYVRAKSNTTITLSEENRGDVQPEVNISDISMNEGDGTYTINGEVSDSSNDNSTEKFRAIAICNENSIFYGYTIKSFTLERDFEQDTSIDKDKKKIQEKDETSNTSDDENIPIFTFVLIGSSAIFFIKKIRIQIRG